MIARGTVRPAAVAGRFYPADPGELAAMVRAFLAGAETPTQEQVKALIVPHAGYVYSGPVAASGYASLGKQASAVRRVVCLGPSHYVPFIGLAATRAVAFETPVGRVAVDTEAVERALTLAQVRALDAAHAHEHSLEVQLPFLQLILGEFTIAPFVAAGEAAEASARLLREIWGGPETLIVVSSDLSHYEDYDTARSLDAATSRAIEALRPEDVSEESACGRVPVRALLRVARERGLRARAVDLRNSGDTAGPRDSVVGYGAYIFT